MSSELGGLRLSRVLAISELTSVGEVLQLTEPAKWVVVVSASTGRPKAAMTTAALREAFAQPNKPLSELIDELPPIGVVEADTPILIAQRWARQQSLSPDDLIVVTQGGHPVGLINVENLARADLGTEYRGGSQLPGPIKDPGKISRSCQFRKGFRLCGDRREFDYAPSTMPQCFDPKRLGPHKFGW